MELEYAGVCFVSLSIIFLRSIHSVVCIRSLFFFCRESYPRVWMHHILLICSPGRGHLGCNQCGATMSHGAMNICIEISMVDVFRLTWVDP